MFFPSGSVKIPFVDEFGVVAADPEATGVVIECPHVYPKAADIVKPNVTTVVGHFGGTRLLTSLLARTLAPPINENAPLP
jgi:hypothetical protein